MSISYINTLLTILLVFVLAAGANVFLKLLTARRWKSLYSRIGDAYTTKEGVRYFINDVAPARYRPGKYEVSVEYDVHVKFAFEPEGRVHSLARRFGFASEFQTGDNNFDGLVYIDSDDPKLYSKLQNNHALRDSVLRLFQLNALCVGAQPRRLSVSFKNRIFRQEDVIEMVLPHLTKIREELPASVFSSARPDYLHLKKFTLMCRWFFWIGLAAVLFPSIRSSMMVMPLNLFGYSLQLAAVIVLLSLWAIQRNFQYSALGYNIFKEFIFTGIIGCIVWAYTILFLINIYADNSAGSIYIEPIVGRYITYDKNNDAHYNIAVKSWNLPNQTFSLSVNESVFTATEGGKIKIITHPGYLGYEWVEKYQVIPK